MRLLKLFLAVLAVVLAVVLIPAAAVFAAEPDIVSADAVVRLDPLLLSFLVGSAVPLAVALIAKLRAGSGLKAVLNVVLSIAGGVLAAYVADIDSALTLLEIATAAIGTYLGSVSTYHSLWKPTGVTNAIGTAVPGGLGAGKVPPRAHGEPEVHG